MNVIVVVCNSLHLGFLGAYGSGWIETPNLDWLASEGGVWDSAISTTTESIMPVARVMRALGESSLPMRSPCDRGP